MNLTDFQRSLLKIAAMHEFLEMVPAPGQPLRDAARRLENEFSQLRPHFVEFVGADEARGTLKFQITPEGLRAFRDKQQELRWRNELV